MSLSPESRYKSRPLKIDIARVAELISDDYGYQQVGKSLLTFRLASD